MSRYEHANIRNSVEKLQSQPLRNAPNTINQVNLNFSKNYNDVVYKNKLYNKKEDRVNFLNNSTDRIDIVNCSFESGLMDNNKFKAILNENPEIRDKLNLTNLNSSCVNKNEKFSTINLYRNNEQNKNSLKNLTAVKNKLDSLFDKNIKNDKGFNIAIDNLSKYLTEKNNKNNSTQMNNKSTNLMEEIHSIR